MLLLRNSTPPVFARKMDWFWLCHRSASSYPPSGQPARANLEVCLPQLDKISATKLLDFLKKGRGGWGLMILAAGHN